MKKELLTAGFVSAALIFGTAAFAEEAVEAATDATEEAAEEVAEGAEEAAEELVEGTEDSASLEAEAETVAEAPAAE